MKIVLQGLGTYLVYLDDIIVMGKMFAEHLTNLKKVLIKLRQANLKLTEEM